MKRIMIIDEDVSLLEILTETLKDDGKEVSSLSDGKNIFQQIDTFSPHLIIIDHQLQGIDTDGICRQIKSNPDTATLPVIILSAYPENFNIPASHSWSSFVEKPFDMWALLDIINSYFRNIETSTYESSK